MPEKQSIQITNSFPISRLLSFIVGTLIVAICLDAVDCIPVSSAVEIEGNGGAIDDTRKWSSGVGLWGRKRSSVPAIDDQLLSFIDSNQQVKIFVFEAHASNITSMNLFRTPEGSYKNDRKIHGTSLIRFGANGFILCYFFGP